MPDFQTNGVHNVLPELLGRFRRAVFFVRSFRRVILGILALAFVVAGLNPMEPLILKFLFDEIGDRKNFGT